MKAKFRFVLSICMLVVASSALAEFKPIEGATLEEMIGGDKIKRIVTAAPAIEVFRLGDSKPRPSSAKFPTSETPDVIGALTDVKNYGERYLCDFVPGVKFRFATDEGNVDIVICFACGEMRLYLDEAIIKRDIRWVGSQNSFSPTARRAFVSLAKKAFPKDAQIQSLRQ